MLYEPWIETASNFRELTSRLKNRGYSNINAAAVPLLDFKAYTEAPVANTGSCKVVRTMLRKQNIVS